MYSIALEIILVDLNKSFCALVKVEIFSNCWFQFELVDIVCRLLALAIWSYCDILLPAVYYFCDGTLDGLTEKIKSSEKDFDDSLFLRHGENLTLCYRNKLNLIFSVWRVKYVIVNGKYL
uniref:Transmembrane protein n=1 Tax=Syphacia muris TaxID=451379 RepID=A0A0N5AMW1_9BILA